MVSDFFSFYFCSFLGSLFDHCLTNVWTTFGCLFGCLLGAFSGLLRFSWKPLDPKTLKNYWFFKLFENAASWLFEAPDGSLGLILPPLWPIWSQNGPQRIPKTAQKAYPNLTIHFLLFFFKAFFWPQKRPSQDRSERFFLNIRLIFFAHFWVPFLTSF